MSGPAALRVDYLPLARLAQQPPHWWCGVLGVVGFESPPPPDALRAPVPVTASSTPLLGSEQPLCEVWRVEAAAGANDGDAQGGRLHHRHDGQLLFGCIRIEEAGLRPGGGAAATLRHATELAYQDIFALLRRSGYPHLIRVWNYLPEINAECEGDERYRLFNSARQSAFAQAGAAAPRSIPAASALGSRAGSPVSIHFLAARNAPVTIENPRQVSAYHYPRQYGEHSPLFSRACTLRLADDRHLFVSGTASIVGHETLHHGDVLAQTRESMTNIMTLVEEANTRESSGHFDAQRMQYKVYVRRRQDQPMIAAELQRWLPESAPVVYVEADVCREDLLVEIEASGIGAAGT